MSRPRLLHRGGSLSKKRQRLANQGIGSTKADPDLTFSSLVYATSAAFWLRVSLDWNTYQRRAGQKTWKDPEALQEGAQRVLWGAVCEASGAVCVKDGLASADCLTEVLFTQVGTLDQIRTKVAEYMELEESGRGMVKGTTRRHLFSSRGCE
eukprot:scaffold69378_cov15-Tisochrysis_lutea.AAC.1